MTKIALIREIVELEQRLSRVMRQHQPEVWMDLNLTIAQLKSVFFIANRGSINLRTLAAALGVTPADVTGIVDRLVEQGLVSRTENPEDRRMLLVRATDKGEALVTNLRQTTMGRITDLLSRMNVDELTTLVRGLTSLVRAAEAHEGENKDEDD